MGALAKKKAIQAGIVFIAKNDVFTDSLIVAGEFGKLHKNVISSIERRLGSENPEIIKFSRLNFKPRDYIDERGKTYRKFEMTEDGFLELAMSFTGEKAMILRMRFINAFRDMRKTIENPPRNEAMEDKRKASHPMMDMLDFTRGLLGKETKKFHYGNEHLFCNRALTGVWAEIDESALDNYDLRLLAAIRRHNAKLIPHYPSQKGKRYELMEAFVADYRARHPRLKLVTNNQPDEEKQPCT